MLLFQFITKLEWILQFYQLHCFKWQGNEIISDALPLFAEKIHISQNDNKLAENANKKYRKSFSQKIYLNSTKFVFKKY